MRTISTIVLGALLAGAAVPAAPGFAGAQLRGSNIGDAAVGVNAALPTQFSAQRRNQRATKRAAPARATGAPVTTIESTYRDPSSRGALLNCSFC
jgi:hypothetical protein